MNNVRTVEVTAEYLNALREACGLQVDEPGVRPQ
jgi:hypothetical protein